MKSFFKQIGVGLVSAIVGGIVSIILLYGGWVGSTLVQRMKFEIADLVVQQFDYIPQQSKQKIQHVDFTCPAGSKLVTASCNETDSTNHLQVAITTINDDGSVSCDRAGPDANALVKATAICFRIKNTFQ